MASSRKSASRKPSKVKADLLNFLSGSSKTSTEKIYKTAKVGIVTALIGGIFKAMALTETFPRPFDTMGNVILFFSFLIMLFAFLFFWFWK